MPTFDEIFARWTWLPIRHCPGRFVLSDGPTRVPLHELIGRDLPAAEFRPDRARDPVVVVKLDRGGIISYRRSDGRFVHTLNSPDGFERKLQQLRISLT